MAVGFSVSAEFMLGFVHKLQLPVKCIHYTLTLFKVTSRAGDLRFLLCSNLKTQLKGLYENHLLFTEIAHDNYLSY